MTWRLPVGATLSLLAGVGAALLFQNMAAPLIIGAAVLGVAAGVVWKSEAVHAANRTRLGISPQDPPISWPVAFLGHAIMGMILGGWLMGLTSVMIGSMILAAVPFAVAPLLGKAFRRRFAMRALLLAAGGMAAGDLLLLAVNAAHS